MVVQQVIEIEYTLLQWINRGRTGGVFVEVEFIQGKHWQPFKFTSGTGQFAEKPKHGDSGVFYSREVRCNVVADNADTLSLINKLEHSDIVVRVKYNTGEWKVIGIPGNPPKMVAELDVHKSGGFKVSFSCDSIYRACFLKA